MSGEPNFRSRPARVLVAGGGIAGVELVVALPRLAAERVEIELLSDEDHLLYTPLLVAEPFGVTAVHRFPLREILEHQGVRRHSGRLAGVHGEAHEAITAEGDSIPYDALAIATGARAHDAVPGTLCFKSSESVAPMRELVERAERGELRSVAFALPEPAQAWPLPLYELALMTAARAPRARVTLASAEAEPLGLFGHEASEAVRRRVEEAGVELRTGAAPLRFADGTLELAGGETVAAEAAVSLPALEVPPLDGVPQGERGFVPVDAHGRVPGLADVYAAGDVTDYPVKQGGVSVRQAQAVAELLAARAGAPIAPQPFEPVLRGVLLTGGEPSYLQSGAGESLLAQSPLWWPPTKIADSYLVPFLVGRFRIGVPPLPHPGEGDIVPTGPGGGEAVARPSRPSRPES